MIDRKWIAILGCLACLAMLNLKALAAGSDTSSLEGKPAPDVSLKTSDGQDFKLSSLKGDVVMIDYWATWCPPCRASLPHVNDLSKDEDLKSKGLHVYAANDKEDAETVKKFVTENKYTFTVLMDPTAAFGKDYLVRGIPTTVIIGRDGVIKKVFIGYGAGMEKPMKQAIEKALAEPKPAT